MSGQATKAVIGDLARAHVRPGGSDIESHGNSLRRRVTAAARRVRDLSITRGNGDELGGEYLGLDVHDLRIIQDRDRFNALLCRTNWGNDDLNRALALSVSLIPDSLSVKPARHGSFNLGVLRLLDFISYPPSGVIRGMPPLGVVVLVLSALLLLVDPSDWVGEIKGALAVLVPVLLYWWKQRRDELAKRQEDAHETADSILRFSSEKEKRLEERASSLREEEREFMHQQMKLSRARGHVLARGYMAVEMANDRLIELLREKNIEVPQALLTYKTRAMVLSELKELEAQSGPQPTPDFKQDSP